MLNAADIPNLPSNTKPAITFGSSVGINSRQNIPHKDKEYERMSVRFIPILSNILPDKANPVSSENTEVVLLMKISP